jgi:glycosyltransferase involved in cell wall biosynthesis
MTIDVSIVIPTFRRPRELREAIKSVRRQDEGLPGNRDSNVDAS